MRTKGQPCLDRFESFLVAAIKAQSNCAGDSFSDLVWQNDSGDATIWLMNGTSVISGPGLGNPGPSWHIKVSE